MNAEGPNTSSMTEKAILQAKKYMEEFKDTQLNIAVTGKSGAGKSTFVNALRGMKNSDDGAAPTGVVETTIEPKKFPHPLNPMVTLWDLPGIGTTKFPAHQYLEYVNFKTYDFFIIIAADRFTENDAQLAEEIKKMGKKFYFVRSKIDTNLRDEKRDKREYDEGATLQKIRENCKTGLEDLGVKHPQVFLVSSVLIHLYDFPALQETWQRELSSIKRDVLILALPNISSPFITTKKEVYSSQIPFHALLAGGVGALPIPGLSFGADLGIVKGVLQEYLDGFGLNVKSLEKISRDTNRPLADLKAGLKCPFSGEEVTVELVMQVLKSSNKTTAMIVATAVCWIPFIGTIIAASLSISTIGSFLQEMLDSLCVDADTFLQKVMVSMADQEDFE